MKKRLTIELDEDLFYSLKSYCVKNKTTFKEFVTNKVLKEINK